MIGILFIGCSPRPALVQEFKRTLPQGVQILQRGVLDGMSREQIRSLAPRDTRDTLFTTLPDGTSVKLSHAAITRHLRLALEDLQNAGCRLVVLCCTGEFPELENLPVLLPSRIHTRLAIGIGASRRLGIYVPLPEQQEVAKERWRACGFSDPISVALAPGSSQVDIVRAAEQMRAAEPELIVYDCMGYTSELRASADDITRRPAILSISLVARVVAELLHVR